jgi:phage shock protein PspC (stress-responsive transcriptional regulator)
MASKLVRSSDEAQVLGVCAGIAHTYDVDISIVRIVTFCTLWFSGMGLIPYLLAYVILPTASTRRSRLPIRS